MPNKEHKLALWVQALIVYESGVKIDNVINITGFPRRTIYALKAKATKGHTPKWNIHLEGRTHVGNIETEGIYTQRDTNTKGIYSRRDALIKETYIEGYIHWENKHTEGIYTEKDTHMKGTYIWKDRHKKTHTKRDTHIEEYIHGEYIHMWKKYTRGGHTNIEDKYTKVHIHEEDIHMEGCTYKKAHTERNIRVGTETLRRHTWKGHIHEGTYT